MSWKPAWLAIALVVPVGCAVDDLDRPQPQSDPPRAVVAAGSGGTVGSGGAGGDASGTTTGAGGAGGSTGVGASLLLYEYCGCLEGFVEPTIPACETCVNTSMTVTCAAEWGDCMASQLCQDILAELAFCNAPFDANCIDVAVLTNEPGVTTLATFLACACNSACPADCPGNACQ